MSQDDPGKSGHQSLSELTASRLLERASEIDAARAANRLDVSALRAAASEAGISTSSFDAALAELGEGDTTGVRDKPAHTPRRRTLWTSIVAGALLVAAGSLAVIQRSVPASPVITARVPMIEQSYLLRCIPRGDAAELVRPLLALPENTVVLSKGSQVMRVRATLAQQQEVKAMLDRHERELSTTCVSGPKSDATATPPSSSPSRP